MMSQSDPRHADPVQTLRKLLPPGIFRPAPKKLVFLFGHLLLIVICYTAIRFRDGWWVLPICSLIIGHSLTCIGILSHELSHHMILRNKSLEYLLETFFWGINFVSPTVWNRVHNQTHHHQANMPGDPDRPFLASEATDSTAVRWYVQIFNPHRGTRNRKWLVMLGFIPYTIRNIVAVIYWDDRKPSIVPFKPTYDRRQRWKVAAEVVQIGLIQWGVFEAVGASWINYLWASPLAYIVTSTLIMGYIFTHHWLRPLADENDALASTTSVDVHPWIDRMHHHFSHHVEHHLFPGINSTHYPLVKKLLLKNFPDQYHHLPFFKAWECLWKGNATLNDPVSKPKESIPELEPAEILV